MSPNIHGAVHIKYNGAKSKHCTHNFHFILFSVAFEYSPMYSCREMVRCRCECVFVGQNLIYISRTKTKKKKIWKNTNCENFTVCTLRTICSVFHRFGFAAWSMYEQKSLDQTLHSSAVKRVSTNSGSFESTYRVYGNIRIFPAHEICMYRVQPRSYIQRSNRTVTFCIFTSHNTEVCFGSVSFLRLSPPTNRNTYLIVMCNSEHTDARRAHHSRDTHTPYELLITEGFLHWRK